MQTIPRSIRILLVDDQTLIRKTIQMYLEPELDMEVVGHAKNGVEALMQVERLIPDIVILDLEMPDMDGLTTTRMICDRFERTKILVFSSHDDHDRINQAIEAGAKGYLIKGTPAQELASAIRSINQGYFQLGPGLMEKLVVLMSNSTQITSNSLEEKLIFAFQKFEQDTNRKIAELLRVKSMKLEGQLQSYINVNFRDLNKKYDELHSYITKVEFKLYLFILIQISLISIFILYKINP